MKHFNKILGHIGTLMRKGYQLYQKKYVNVMQALGLKTT